MTDATLWLAKWVGPVKGVDNDETSSNSPEDDSLLLVAEILRSRTTVRIFFWKPCL